MEIVTIATTKALVLGYHATYHTFHRLGSNSSPVGKQTPSEPFLALI